jgi:hypothetical protein
VKAHVSIDEAGVTLLIEPEPGDRELARALWDRLSLRPLRIVEVRDVISEPSGFGVAPRPFGTELRLE